jgi:hypothetical protein
MAPALPGQERLQAAPALPAVACWPERIGAYGECLCESATGMGTLLSWMDAWPQEALLFNGPSRF